MKLPILALLFGLALGSLYADAPSIDWIENSAPLAPTRTLELRFSHDMIAPDALPEKDNASPIETIPPVAGKWTWQSTKSGRA